MSPELAELWKVLEATPPGDGLSVLADLADELGEDPGVTAALRWMGKNGKKPEHWTAPVPSVWIWNDSDSQDPEHTKLPDSVNKKYNRHPENLGSFRDAVTRLARWGLELVPMKAGSQVGIRK